ncbi:hypothetical protein ABKV19_004220, partial [Rosa sericea]
MVRRGREARMILEVQREQMDDGDAAKAGRRSFKQRLRLTGIGCCGAAWVRHKCPACYKQYKKKEHLIEHKKVAFHSAHDPICGVCRKPCKSFESLRAHLT